MSHLFDLRDDKDAPPFVQLASLRETYGIEPAHVIGEASNLLIVTIGSGRYVSRKDLDRFLDWCAETALYQRMGKSTPPKPRFEHEGELSDEVPDCYRIPVEEALKDALAKLDRAPEAAIA